MNRDSTIVLLINPNGNKQKIDKIVNEIAVILDSKNQLFVSFKEEWPALINIYKAAWIIGGDGTLNYFLNFYKDISIPISIFKGGTGNDFAWKLYGDISTNEQIDKIFSAESRYVDAAVCNGKIFINGIGIGFDGEVLRSIKTVRKLGGHVGYLWIVIKKIFSFREFAFQIKLAEKSIEGNFLLVMITNSSRTGGGFMVSPQANIADGKLNMVLCKPLSLLKRLRYLPVIEKGKHIDLNFIIHKEIQQIKITAEKEIFAQMDGELIYSNEFDVTILPKKYLFRY